MVLTYKNCVYRKKYYLWNDLIRKLIHYSFSLLSNKFKLNLSSEYFPLSVKLYRNSIHPSYQPISISYSTRIQRKLTNTCRIKREKPFSWHFPWSIAEQDRWTWNEFPQATFSTSHFRADSVEGLVAAASSFPAMKITRVPGPYDHNDPLGPDLPDDHHLRNSFSRAETNLPFSLLSPILSLFFSYRTSFYTLTTTR